MCKIGGSISNIEMYKKLDSKENVGIKKQTNEINTKDSTDSTITKMPNNKDSKQVGNYKKDQSSELTDSIKSKFDKMFDGGLKELSKSKDGIKGELKSHGKEGKINSLEGELKELSKSKDGIKGELKSHGKEGKINSHEGGLKEKFSKNDSIKEGFSKLGKNESMKEQIKEKLKDLKMTPDIHVEKHTLEMTPEKAGKLKEAIQKMKSED